MADVVVVKVPGIQGPQGVSAVNNIVNPILSADLSFTNKTEIAPLGYSIPPNASLTFEATLIIKGLVSNDAIVSVEGPTGSTVFSAMHLPYKATPMADGRSVSFNISSEPNSGSQLVKLSGSIITGATGGDIKIYLDNMGDDTPYVAASSFVQWSLPVIGIINGGIAGALNSLIVRVAALEEEIEALKAGQI